MENEQAPPGADRHDGGEAHRVTPPIVQAERARVDHEQRKQYQRAMFAIFFAPAPGSDVEKMTQAHRLLHEAPLVLRHTLVNYLTAIQRVHLGSWTPAPPRDAPPTRKVG